MCSGVVVTGADVCSYMLLQDQRIGELLVTDTAGMQSTDRRLGAVHAHVSLEITLCRERAPADLTAERALARVRSIVHLQGALAAECSQADGALVGIGQLLVDAAHKLFHLARFRRLLDLHELLERIFGLAVA